jgi:4-amino-4-deoxy-L-arabinose transferase-like glycosyltransferase
LGAITAHQHSEGVRARSTRYLWLAMACVAVAAALRIPFWPATLFSEDCFNFAQALTKFDPRHLVPQPPGYPVFVLQSKLLHLIFGTAERTFLAGVVLGTAAALFFLTLLAREMTRSWRATAIAFALFVTSPTFWITGVASTIRIYIAVVTLAVVLFSWKLYWGERKWWWAAALALGFGSGYRPELLPFLFPVWFIGTMKGVGDTRTRVRTFVLLLASFLVWFVYLYSHFESWRAFWEVQTRYLEDQSQDFSALYGAEAEGWVRMTGKFVAWYGIGVLGWVGFLPFARARLAPGARMILAWAIVPLAAFHLLVHIGSPDHAIGQIALLSLIGGAVITNLWMRYPDLKWLAIVAALVVNVALFWRPPVLTPPTKDPARYALKQVTDALWENSWPWFENTNTKSEASLNAVRDILKKAPSGTLVAWNRSELTWRKLSYYEPALPILLILDSEEIGNRPHAAVWRGLQLQKRLGGEPVFIPLDGAQRILWIMDEFSPLRKALGTRAAPAGAGVYLSQAEPFEVRGYRFVKEPTTR